MKCIYHSERLRVKVVNKKDFIGTNLIVLKIQEKRWIFWYTVHSQDIEVNNYWGYVPSHELWGKHMTLHYQFGGTREIWPPDIFDLKKRANELLSLYFENNRRLLLNERAIKKQMQSL
jgi:hypothetical protein